MSSHEQQGTQFKMQGELINNRDNNFFNEIKKI